MEYDDALTIALKKEELFIKVNVAENIFSLTTFE
jgi:hypothetical protein